MDVLKYNPGPSFGSPTLNENIEQLNLHNDGQKIFGLDKEPLKLPIDNNGPVKFQSNFLKEDLSNTGYAGTNDFHLQSSYNFPQLMISKDIEIPLLQQSHIQPIDAFYKNKNYINQDYYGPVKRNGQTNNPGKIRIEPAIAYAVKNSRIWRI